jgi:hypothetical protein
MSATPTVCLCCGGTGLVGARSKIRVKEVLAANALCVTEDTVYDNRRTGRWPWLTRISPEGRPGRDLWIVVAQAVPWFLARGRHKDADRLLELARRQGR